MNAEQIGKTIKKLRLEKKLTQKDFADQLGVTYQAVSKWENGKNMPDLILLQEISTILGIDINELLTGKKQHKKNHKPLIIGLLLLVLVIIIFISIIIKNNYDFEFKTITSNCDDFLLTGSAAYNNDKTSIYISDVNYCGQENDTIYKSFNCVLYEDYKDTKTKIGSCGISSNPQTLNAFLDTVKININNYEASCKMFSSSSLYMEIQAIDNEEKTTTYQIPINLEDNCKQ